MGWRVRVWYDTSYEEGRLAVACGVLSAKRNQAHVAVGQARVNCSVRLMMMLYMKELTTLTCNVGMYCRRGAMFHRLPLFSQCSHATAATSDAVDTQKMN
jgi:hypothetical protein